MPGVSSTHHVLGIPHLQHTTSQVPGMHTDAQVRPAEKATASCLLGPEGQQAWSQAAGWKHISRTPAEADKP